MADQSAAQGPDHIEMANDMARIAAQSQRIVADFVARHQQEGGQGAHDPLNIGQAFLEMTQRMMSDPARLVEAQMKLWDGYMRLWQYTAQRMTSGEVPPEPVVQPLSDDRRFKDPAWSENALFDFIKQSYLLTADWLQTTVRDTEGLESKEADKVSFYTRQFVDAMAPTNFIATNPVVLRETLESRGENLVRGLKNMLDDIERGEGRLDIRMTDEDRFEVGENLALTPGKVVFQNELMQLIQYEPTTKQVYRRPLLIIPPWINKYYILDLRPENSFVRWAVGQGYTVFMTSWVNPDEKLSHKGFEDYMVEGPLAALDAMHEATGEREANVIGYCLGGTLLAATLAHMAAKGDDRFKSATYLATMVDFTDPGELGVFIDEAQLEALEEMMREKGYLEGSQMAKTFNMLRANDLIWSFVVNNYLMGKDPFPFDLLYWNSDSTRMPADMHSFYLRKMYQENLLVQPGGITLGGTPIDLTAIKQPSYLMAAREDHIAPWASAFQGAGLYSGTVKFVLGASGHIAGVVNPPDAKKYGYWTGKVTKGMDAEAWLAKAEAHEGSWWPDWDTWQKPKAGGKVAARKPGDGTLKPIEDAPGSYVRTKV